MKPSGPPNATSTASLRLHFRNGERLGPGKIELLEHLARERSISGAARAMGMAYRRAWLLVDDMNRMFAEPVVQTFPGRSQGAGAQLTAFGERLIALFRAAERRSADAVALQLQALDEALNPAPSAAQNRDADAG
ncbi:MAG: winged helix-turn-helix domain-containing protein [Gammaproteobacteria bacterium]|jgi:molybdate transport system regulatory protein|nr:winged helix-turn-helix domain-containing protein [Gammaproteobacteria bacterium]MBU0772596.1 winged helix-turn-helix domain-containing protein [Gammaproteobacteria bacterium]MBU0855196.1 winged helix-turn-helix domain-containing protein [Gammaproteobacteria bacterium]MBU1847386.1 winged helix-turn-helix domain-containing protein [Gammaproteobacteria bacterium]